jgi:hypothetical protein
MLAGGQDQQNLITVVASDSALCLGEGLLPRASHNFQMVKGLHVIDRRFLQLMNKYSIYRGVFKYKEKNLGVLYAPLGQSLCLELAFCKTLKEIF